MKNALPESKKIYDQLLNDEQKENVEIFLQVLINSKKQYETDIIWKMDQKIGGVGGYCMPADPKINLFPGGLNRELFRPLQYARSEIDISDIRMNSRYVVLNSGMHLEVVLKLYLKNNLPLGNLRITHLTLGKEVNEISKMNIFAKKYIDALFDFVTLYNKAKHEVNMIEERPRLFEPSDAIICYLCARIIGQEVLKKLQYPVSQSVYEINNEQFNS